jgi:hypothetical protein
VVSTDPNDFCPDPLYHYTSAAGLLGIISTGTVWGSNYSYLDDPLEITYGRNVAVDVVEREISECDSGFALLLARVQERLKAPEEGSDIYLTSFCGSPDLLGQWRAYGRAKGRFCIGFDSDAMCLGNMTRLGAAVYDAERQFRAVQFVIEVARRTFRESGNEDPSFAGVIESELLLEILQRVTFFKHPSYVEESEWRAVHFASESSLVHLRLVDDMIKPFVDIMGGPKRGFEPGSAILTSITTGPPPLLPISEIIVGGSRVGPLARKAVELLLEKHGYRDVWVQDSSISFRDL